MSEEDKEEKKQYQKNQYHICLKKTHKKKEYQKSDIKICLKKTNKNIKMHKKNTGKIDPSIC